MSVDTIRTDDPPKPPSILQIGKMIGLGVIVLSVLLCVAIAVARSSGLTQVTVTALNAEAEHHDQGMVVLKPQDALPDYKVLVMLNSGQAIELGTKPNTSALAGLSWTLNEPVAVADIAGVRLEDQDKIVSDTIAEVQVTEDTVSTDDYRFDFQTERSFGVGVQSFFTTPIGMAIVGAFFFAVLIVLLGGIAP